MEDKNVKNLNYEERENILNNCLIDKEIYDYIKNIISNVFINVNDKEESILSIFDNKEKNIYHIEMCESLILFFNSYDYVIRGYITMAPQKQFWHYWIGFSYKGELYVFDPSLKIIAYWSTYKYVFEVDDAMMIPGNIYKQAFKEILDKQKENIIVKNIEKNKPFFNNESRIDVNLVNDKLKKLVCKIEN